MELADTQDLGSCPKGCGFKSREAQFRASVRVLFYLGGKSTLSIRPSDFSMKDKIPGEVIAIGISASLANLLVSVTTIIVNKELGEINELYVPAYGVTSKILMIVSMLGIGFSAGVHFTKIMLLTVWLTGTFVVLQNTLQAIGAAVPALLASLFRQAVLYIPMLFIMKSILGGDGIIWAQPICDVLSLVIIILMLSGKLRRVKWESNNAVNCESNKELS